MKRPILALIVALVAVLAAVAFVYLAGAGGPSPEGGGGEGDGGGGGDAPVAAERGDPRDAVDLVPVGIRDRMSPLLAEASAWPADAELAPLSNIPAESRPDPKRVDDLIDRLSRFVPKEMLPENPADAAAVTRDGELFARLVGPGVYGQATLDRTPDGDRVSFRWSFDDEEPMDADKLLERLRAVSSERLGADLGSDEIDRGEHPEVNGEDGYQATYVMDGTGVGQLYPFVTIYATKRDVIVVLQSAAPNHVPPAGQ